MQSIPFTLPDVHGGLSEGTGAVYVEGDELVIEAQVKLLSLIDRKPQAYRIELIDLESVAHRRTVLGDRVTIRTRPLDLLADVPGAGNGELVLKFKRRHRAAVDDLLDRLKLWRTG